jgi:hypothetical protein
MNFYEDKHQTFFIENINTSFNGYNTVFKSLCIKNSISYYAERSSIQNKNVLITSNDTDKNIKIYDFNLECEDPRLFVFLEKIYIIFNIKRYDVYGRYMCISEYENFNPIILKIEGMSPNNIEKNWSPFVKNDKLYFVYLYDPLVILHYDLNKEGICKVIFCQNNIPLPINTSQIYLRGSTNLVNYKNDIYISLCHSRIGTNRINKAGYNYHYYFTHICLLDTIHWKITYVSKPLLFNYENDNSKHYIKTLPNTTVLFNEDEYRCVMYATSLNKIDENNFIVTMNINDHIALSYKLKINQIDQDNKIYEIYFWDNKTKEMSIDLIKNCSTYQYEFIQTI